MIAPRPADYCSLSLKDKPRLLVVVDTEEEFDWSGERSRDNIRVSALRQLSALQKIFDSYNIAPVYVVDYPVVLHPDGYSLLKEIHATGRCVIGAHLHPWVNPPFEEPLSSTNSFPGNLPRTLEYKKLETLDGMIEARFGERPVIYKAGRYGIGPNTAEILEERGYQVDMSVCPHMDYSAEGGPNFLGASEWPYWFGTKRRLLELPLTVGFSGALRKWGNALYALASRSELSRLHGVGFLARLRLVDKIWLSPEGYTSAEHERLTCGLIRDGLRIFSFAFHSPSIEPGHTPYVRSRSDAEHFFGRCRAFFDFFFGKLGGVATTPLELKQQLQQKTSGKVAL